MNQFHAVGGRYSKEERWVGLDYATSFMSHPEHLESILAHELVHSVIANDTDFGQASFVVFALKDDFKHVSRNDARRFEQLLFGAQDFVQEGLATFMQIGRLRKLIGRQKALRWAQEHLPPYYLEMLNAMDFVQDMSNKNRDHFTRKMSALTMIQGFRQQAAPLDLLRSPAALEKYLENDDVNPDVRLEKLLAMLRIKPWAITKPPEEIARLAGITFFEVATKKEIAEFQTYVASFTGKPHTFLPEDIGDSKEPSALLDQARDSLLVTNLNLGLESNPQLIIKPEDFLYYADVYDTVFINYHDESWKLRQAASAMMGQDADVAMIGLTKTGEKYATYFSKENAAKALNTELKDVTAVVKWGGYSIEKNRFIWSDTARSPDVVLYNSPTNMRDTLNQHMEQDKTIKLKHLHIGATTDHPLQNIMVIKDGLWPLHLTSDFGAARISEVVKTIEAKSSLINHDDLREHKRDINNALVLMGLMRSVDWVGTMIAQDTLIMRKD
jgi:hypothetical protein